MLALLLVLGFVEGLALQAASPADLVEKLRTDDAQERRRAVLELLKAGPAGAEAALKSLTAEPADPASRIDALVRGLAADAWADRDRAMKELAGLGRGAREALAKRGDVADPEVAWRIRAALAEIEDRSVRDERLDELRDGALAELLGEAGDPRAAAPLLALLRDGAVEKRTEAKIRAVAALGKLRPSLSAAQAEEAAERTIELLGRTAEPRERATLVRALGRLGAAAGLPTLAVLVADRSERDVHLRTEALRALARSSDAAALRAVVEAVEAEDAWVRGAAAATLSALAGTRVDEGPAGAAAARAWWSKRFDKPWE
jgi:HEAT repeat protein